MKKLKWLLILLGMILGGHIGLTYYYNQALRFPAWYHPHKSDDPECRLENLAQEKFDPRIEKVTLHQLQTPQGLMRAWSVKSLLNKLAKHPGAILVHGGGADHNFYNLYAHFLARNGWDTLNVDLPNHGCSYNNGKGLRFGLEEGKNFGRFYDLAESLFDVKAMIATSMGATVAVQYGFPQGKPMMFVLENPMFNMRRIITDQSSYYVPWSLRGIIEEQILFLNRELDLPPITQLMPQPNQKILVLYGSRDKLTPPSIQAPEIKQAWGNHVNIMMIEGGNHSQLMQHAPGEVEKIVGDFLFTK